MGVLQRARPSATRRLCLTGTALWLATPALVLAVWAVGSLPAAELSISSPSVSQPASQFVPENANGCN